MSLVVVSRSNAPFSTWTKAPAIFAPEGSDTVPLIAPSGASASTTTGCVTADAIPRPLSAADAKPLEGVAAQHTARAQPIHHRFDTLNCSTEFTFVEPI